jgi:hypothetical protein
MFSDISFYVSLTVHSLEVEHQRLEFACTIIESNPLFISPVNKNSPVEQIVYTLSSRSSTSTFSSLQELANAEANLVMFSRHLGFRTYEITSRHHSDEGIGNVYFHQPSKRRSVSVKPGSVGLNRGIRRSQSRGPETQSSSAISTSSRTRIITKQPKDDVLHEAWLTFYPGTTRYNTTVFTCYSLFLPMFPDTGMRLVLTCFAVCPALLGPIILLARPTTSSNEAHLLSHHPNRQSLRSALLCPKYLLTTG